MRQQRPQYTRCVHFMHLQVTKVGGCEGGSEGAGEGTRAWVWENEAGEARLKGLDSKCDSDEGHHWTVRPCLLWPKAFP